MYVRIDIVPFYIQCYRTRPVPPGTHTIVLLQKANKMVRDSGIFNITIKLGNSLSIDVNLFHFISFD